VHSCNWLCRVLCFLSAHRWTHPGGHCICCGKCDEFFGPHDHDEEPTRLDEFFNEVESKLPGDLWDEDDV